MILLPRRTWTAGLANPTAGKDPAWTSGDQPRPRLNLPCRHLVVHYSGNPDGFAPGNQFLSVDSRTYMRNMFTWAHGVGEKGDEYNWVVAGTEGTVYEWAGAFRAAHCTNWNSDCVGVQFGLDVDDVPPAVYGDVLLTLRQRLVEDGVLTPDHRVGQHREYLGTAPGPTWKPKTGAWATDCCGTHTIARWSSYDVPLPTPEPQPPTPTEDEMVVRLCKVLYDVPAAWHLNGNTATRLDPDTYAVYAAAGQVPADAGQLPWISEADLRKFTLVASPA